MEKRKEYRSAVRSRRLIRSAFLELLREKTCEKITVTDIGTRADINRSTFYAHYPDVRGLVEESVGEAISYSTELADSLNIKEFLADPMPFLRELTSYGSDNKELYALLCRSEFAQRQMEQLKRTLIDSALRFPAFPESVRSSPEFRIQISFFVGGILSLYVMWLQGELDCTVDDITHHLSQLIQCTAPLYAALE